MGTKMTLIEVVRDLDSFANEGIICATKPWAGNSRSIVLVVPEARRLPEEASNLGLEYFLDVFIAREFLEDWTANSSVQPTLQEKCERLIQYAIDDA